MESKQKTRTERFNELKKRYGLTNPAVALRFGISLRTVEAWAKGDRQPKEYTLALMESTLRHIQKGVDDASG